jgi:hypothetical protein
VQAEVQVRVPIGLARGEKSAAELVQLGLTRWIIVRTQGLPIVLVVLKDSTSRQVPLVPEDRLVPAQARRAFNDPEVIGWTRNQVSVRRALQR